MTRKIDYFFNKLLPKKLIVWTVATVMCAYGKLPGDIWGYITMIYLGVNVAGKFAAIDKKINGEIQ